MEPENKKTTGLMKSSINISKQLIQITKTSDLLKAEPIVNQMQKFGRNDVQVQIGTALNKCAMGLDIPMTNERMQIITEDLVEKYRFDSIEDIQQCLKKGRRGDYGQTYGKLNMIVISDWMSKHLEDKYEAREQAQKATKHEFKTREEYLNAVKVGTKIREEDKQQLKDQKQNEHDYNNFKANYESKKKS